jgi:hypothetical protein
MIGPPGSGKSMISKALPSILPDMSDDEVLETSLTYSAAGQDPQVFRGAESGFVEENRVFVECLLNDTQPPINHVDGLMATLMVLQAFASLKSGKPEPVAALIGR